MECPRDPFPKTARVEIPGALCLYVLGCFPRNHRPVSCLLQNKSTLPGSIPFRDAQDTREYTEDS